MIVNIKTITKKPMKKTLFSIYTNIKSQTQRAVISCLLLNNRYRKRKNPTTISLNILISQYIHTQSSASSRGLHTLKISFCHYTFLQHTHTRPKQRIHANNYHLFPQSLSQGLFIILI